MVTLLDPANRSKTLELKHPYRSIQPKDFLPFTGEEALQDMTIANVWKDCRHAADGYASRPVWQVAPL